MECAVAVGSSFEMLHVYYIADYSTDTLLRAGQIDIYIGTPVAYRTCMHGRRSRQHCHVFVGDRCHRIERRVFKNWWRTVKLWSIFQIE